MRGTATAAPVRQATRAVVSLVRRNGTLTLSGACERIGGTVVELAYLVTVEAFIFDLKVDANQQRRRKLFDREADRLRCRVETSIPHRPTLAAAGGKEVRWRVVIEAHRRCTRIARSRPRTRTYSRASSLSRATRSCGSEALLIRYSSSPPCSGSCLVTT